MQKPGEPQPSLTHSLEVYVIINLISDARNGMKRSAMSANPVRNTPPHARGTCQDSHHIPGHDCPERPCIMNNSCWCTCLPRNSYPSSSWTVVTHSKYPLHVHALARLLILFLDWQTEGYSVIVECQGVYLMEGSHTLTAHHLLFFLLDERTGPPHLT